VSLDKIRNFGIIAHIDAGKTTTTERVLFHTRRIHKIGNVDEGSTTTDFYPEEARRGISIFSAAVTCEWRGHLLNLIDTPGHVDFTAEVERSLRVLDGAVVVFDAVNGVEAQSETVWRQAVRYKVPRMVYLNKMDRPGASYEKSLESIRRKLQGRPVPLTIPWGGGDAPLRGVVDLLRMKALRFEGDDGEQVVEEAIPAECADEASMYRESLVEAASEFSDEVLGLALEGKPVPESSLKAAIRKGTIAGKIQPAYAGTSLHNLGVQPVIDGVVDFLPSPLDVPVVEGKEPETDKPVKVDLRKDKTLCGLAFKTATDKHGELTYVRVYAGTLRAGEAFYNPRLGRMERTQRMFRMFADTREPLDQAGPGEIVAFVGLKNTTTGDTLCEKRAPVLLETMRFPEPVLSVTIEPRSSADKDKLDETLQRLMKDDPTFKVGHDADTGQTIMQCMGELHAEILLYRIQNDFNTPATLGKPRVAYRETVQKRGAARRKLEHLVGERQIFADVSLEVRPNPGVLAPAFTAAFPPEKEKDLRRYVPAVRTGAVSAAGSGTFAGYPVIYLEIVMTDGSVNVNSDEGLYTNAAAEALAEALKGADPILLEPHMKFEVAVPDEYAGGVIHDLQRRGAEIGEMAGEGTTRLIRGNVPLAQMFGYTTTLRSLTQGRGQHQMEPFEYRPLPHAEMEKFRFDR
jgi:elongation factor G